MEKISFGRQITKYLNQYREKEMTLKNAKKKILAITQQVKRSSELPPPPPQVDYEWVSGDEDCRVDPWGSDFDSDQDDDETTNEVNGNITHFQSSNATIPVSHNETNSANAVVYDDSSVEMQPESFSTVPLSFQLPAQPMIPRRKPKPTDAPVEETFPNSSPDSSSATIVSLLQSDGKPLISSKPAILPKPSPKSKSSSPTQEGVTPSAQPVPRPPNNLPLKSHQQRNSVVRPTQQPPPPPVKLLQESASCDTRTPDEYEVPNPYVSSVLSDTASISSCSLSNSSGHNSAQVGELTYESLNLEEEHQSESVDESMCSGSSETSNLSSSSDRPSLPSSSAYDRPKLPPRMISGQSPTPPPLPKKPSSAVITAETSAIRSSEKPIIPLPTRSPKTDENGNKLKDGQLKWIGGTLKNKLIATFLSPEKGLSRTTDYSNASSQSASRSASVSSLSEPSETLSSKVKAQETLGRTVSPVSRSVADDSGSMQNRPLPPVPDSTGSNDVRRPSATPSIDLSKDLMEGFTWFHAVERDIAEQMLKQMESGSYLVRPSRRAGESSPFSLSIQYESRVYHLNIRLKEETKFALGKEKVNEKIFDSVQDLVNHHSLEPIVLTVKGVTTGKTCLTSTPDKR